MEDQEPFLGRDPEEENKEDTSNHLWWCALFIVSQVYGGPEEGGWYYDSGELVTDRDLYARIDLVPAAFTDEDKAYEYMGRMEAKARVLNEDRLPKHSPQSNGVYEAIVLLAPVPPSHFPDARPHYE